MSPRIETKRPWCSAPSHRSLTIEVEIAFVAGCILATATAELRARRDLQAAVELDKSLL